MAEHRTRRSGTAVRLVLTRRALADPIHGQCGVCFESRRLQQLALKGGARLEQIQLSLGHQSIQTTQRYLGVELDLQDAPCDHLGLRMPA